MQKKGANISLKGYDDIFSTDQSRAEAQQERVQEIPLSELHPFEGHPFRVVDLKTVSALVKNILEHDHKARNTDNHLYLMVLEHYSGLRGIDIHAMTVPVFLKELDRRSFPGFETVRRSRQKVQATYPDLAPSEAVGKRRAKNEVVYREFAESEV